MTILKAAERTGLTKKAIRYYETEGLITPELENNGYRDYSEEIIRKLILIRSLRNLSFTIKEIRLVYRMKTLEIAVFPGRLNSSIRNIKTSPRPSICLRIFYPAGVPWRSWKNFSRSLILSPGIKPFSSGPGLERFSPAEEQAARLKQAKKLASFLGDPGKPIADVFGKYLPLLSTRFQSFAQRQGQFMKNNPDLMDKLK